MVCYHSDAENRIVFVNKAWDTFAVENGASELLSTRITGKNLFEFVTGMELQHLQELLLIRARKSLQPLSVPFRGDAPDERRFMEMTITAKADGAVEFVTRLTRQEKRASVDVMRPASERSSIYLMLCSWCNRGCLPEGHWVEVEEATRQLGLFNSDEPLPQLTHGICPSCATKIKVLI